MLRNTKFGILRRINIKFTYYLTDTVERKKTQFPRRTLKLDGKKLINKLHAAVVT